MQPPHPHDEKGECRRIHQAMRSLSLPNLIEKGRLKTEEIEMDTAEMQSVAHMIQARNIVRTMKVSADCSGGPGRTNQPNVRTLVRGHRYIWFGAP